MIEVLTYVNFRENTSVYTFFLATLIMDLFFKNYKTSNHSKKIRDKDVHVIGIACMLIATKYQDVIPISLSEFYRKVAHQEYSK